jgi:hypothetical protein
MKTGAAAIAAAGFCFAAGMVQAAPIDDCAEENRKALNEVETLYQGARLPKPDQDRYKSLHETATKPMKPKGPGGAPLGNCREKTKKIAELKQALLRLITPQVGDRARGGVVFQVSNGGKNGLVADVSDVPVMGGVMIFAAAEQACNQSTASGLGDWYLPNSQELYKLYEQKNVVGGFKTSGRDHYWNSSRMTGQDHKIYWQRFGDGQTGWADTEDRGPNRALFNARCIRKY